MPNNQANPQSEKVITITPHFSVSGQITESTLEALALKGVDTLINVRPDNESENQMSDKDWRALAQKFKLNYVFIPVISCQYTQHDVERFKAGLALSLNSAHSLCRTGTRAAHLWALANQETMPFIEIEKRLKSAGYDLDKISSMFKKH
ncbi:MAG: hypothetical protein ACI9O6_001175 [Glaciecola sp.]|jgi:uncharacterized protein (TIGR01244 family)